MLKFIFYEKKHLCFDDLLLYVIQITCKIFNIMVNTFDKLYTRIENKNSLLVKLKYYSLLRFTIRKLANILLPVYFNFTSENTKYRLTTNTENRTRVIVSLTSFPARINNIWLVIETILRQKTKPDMIILWLSKEQFSSLESLPKKLLKQRERGLVIEFVDDDLRSHKKYFYSFQRFPNDIVITVDDDIFYNSNILNELLTAYKKHPNCIICNLALKVRYDKKEILPYNNWELIRNETVPSSQLTPIGAGGILYPPNSMYKDIFNIETFKKYCFLADDIWLNIMSRLNKTSIVKTGYCSTYLPVLNKSNTTLTEINVTGGLNDKQINETRNYYISSYGLDPYNMN